MDERIEIRRAHPNDAPELVARMRLVDQIECIATLGRNVDGRDIATIVKRDHTTRAALFEGRLVALYGCTREPLDNPVGVPWFLGTHEMSKRPVRRAFVRLARQELEAVSKGTTRLVNACSARNKEALRVLEWLGFTFPGHKRGDVNGVMFQQFEKENDACASQQ